MNNKNGLAVFFIATSILMNFFFFVYYKREGKIERVKQICVFKIINGLYGQYYILKGTNSWVF
jgi:hypothetical protein